MKYFDERLSYFLLFEAARHREDNGVLYLDLKHVGEFAKHSIIICMGLCIDVFYTPIATYIVIYRAFH